MPRRPSVFPLAGHSIDGGANRRGSEDRRSSGRRSSAYGKGGKQRTWDQELSESSTIWKKGGTQYGSRRRVASDGTIGGAPDEGFATIGVMLRGGSLTVSIPTAAVAGTVRELETARLAATNEHAQVVIEGHSLHHASSRGRRPSRGHRGR